ncbi:hypothetical protein ABID08_000699 [Rhizobium binae]|uniref:Uncharacterized protein n=1 Tax=Rhizobium binae TaxID=1138190 RepID=A0ABV2MA92_9HYPH
MIRSKVQNIGGPFPGRGAAPTMSHNKILPRGERAAFERLNDAAAMRPHLTDAGSLVAANDNLPSTVKATPWTSKELRLTKPQADFLKTGQSSVHGRVQDRTEIILESRRMFGPWKKNPDGTYHRPLSPKGIAALQYWNGKRGQ